MLQDGAIEYKKESEGQGWCPYDPTHNSTAIYSGQYITFCTQLSYSLFCVYSS